MNKITKNKILPEYHPIERVLINSPTKESLSIINYENYKNFLFREPIVDFCKYIEEHKNLKQLLKGNGIEVINIRDISFSKEVTNLLNQNPNLIFTRDSVLILPFGAVILNMATKERSKEPIIMKHVLNKLQIPILFEVSENKKIEGGDLIFLNENTLLIGYGPRTNIEGIKFFCKKLIFDSDLIKEIIAIKISPNRINLDGVLMPLSNNIILLDKSSIFRIAKKYTKYKTEKINLFKYLNSQDIKIIEVSKEEGMLLSTNIFNIGNKKLISYKHNHRINNLLRKHGFEILELEGHSLIKGSGGPRCMTNPIRYKQ